MNNLNGLHFRRLRNPITIQQLLKHPRSVCSRELGVIQTFVLHTCTRSTIHTYLTTYHKCPVVLRRRRRLLTVTSWKVARFSFRKNVSGIHILFQLPSPRRISRSFSFLCAGVNIKRLSFHSWRKYMLTE